MTSDPEGRGLISDAMVQFFTDEEWKFLPVQESILQMGFKGQNGSFACYAQALDEYQRFSYHTVMESNVPEEKRLAVAEFVTRVNFGLFLGNFEMDFSDGELRFKTSIDVEDGELTQEMIRKLVYSNVMMMDKYLPGIMSIIYAGTSPAEALARIQQAS
jgi:hypothetical protein